VQDITVAGPAIIDILAGHINKDVFQAGSQPMDMVKLSFGGDALNEAVVLSRMGKRTGLISKVGDDAAGKQVLNYIGSNGIPLDGITIEKGLETGINIVLVDGAGERYFLTNPQGSLRKLSKEDILPRLGRAADIVCFASIFVSPLIDIPAMEHIFRKVKEKPGRILAADMTKAKNGEKLEDLRQLCRYIDYIFPNQEEIALLTGETDPVANAGILIEAGVYCAVIKCGSNGCIIRTKDEMYKIPAYPVEKAIDSTGAGDCFTAGFLWGLSEGMGLEECGYMACATASCTVEHAGATDGIVSVSKVMERYNKLYADYK